MLTCGAMRRAEGREAARRRNAQRSTPHACGSSTGIRQDKGNAANFTRHGVMRSPAALNRIAVAIRDGQLVP